MGKFKLFKWHPGLSKPASYPRIIIYSLMPSVLCEYFRNIQLSARPHSHHGFLPVLNHTGSPVMWMHPFSLFQAVAAVFSDFIHLFWPDLSYMPSPFIVPVLTKYITLNISYRIRFSCLNSKRLGPFVLIIFWVLAYHLTNNKIMINICCSMNEQMIPLPKLR